MFCTPLLATALSIAAVPGLAQWHDPTRHIWANFTSIDANGDGVISRAEFRTARAARWPQIDRNGDGYLSEEDFPAIAMRRARTQLAAIADLDTDGDGRISQGEFLDGPTPLFDQADRNANGALARSEVEEQAN